MKLNTFTDKKGRQITYGTGTPEEIDLLNKVEDFNKALDIIEHIRERKEGLFGNKFGNKVNRGIYGKRKNS